MDAENRQTHASSPILLILFTCLFFIENSKMMKSNLNTTRIFCIGRNYAGHIKELKNTIPAKPVILSNPQPVWSVQEKKFIFLNMDMRWR